MRKSSLRALRKVNKAGIYTSYTVSYKNVSSFSLVYNTLAKLTVQELYKKMQRRHFSSQFYGHIKCEVIDTCVQAFMFSPTMTLYAVEENGYAKYFLLFFNHHYPIDIVYYKLIFYILWGNYGNGLF